MINLSRFTKNDRQVLAQQWINHLTDNYVDEIKESIDHTYYVSENITLKVPDDDSYTTFAKPAEIYIVPTDTVSCLFKHKKNEPEDVPVGVLNFASYKHPGGMFYSGSSAQEEALCHHSTLIYSLNTMKDEFYIPHKNMLSHGLYGSDAIISTKITFIDRTLDENKVDDTTKAGVITMAAPNLGAYIRNGHDSCDELYIDELVWRIVALLNVASLYDFWDLILGAFGCGVFKNDPMDVADSFFHSLTLTDSRFKFAYRFRKVFFAIPRTFYNNDNNYKAFCEVGKKYGVKVLEDY